MEISLSFDIPFAPSLSELKVEFSMFCPSGARFSLIDSCDEFSSVYLWQTRKFLFFYASFNFFSQTKIMIRNNMYVRVNIFFLPLLKALVRGTKPCHRTLVVRF
jgi:hypothetical protein